MSNKNDQLARMKDLINYGKVNEDVKPISSYNIEQKAQAADGKYYAIIRENSKFYVKVATPGKETIAESYQYIGGVQNKKNYEYGSYANALKHFELKLGSINEAYDENRRVNVETLDPYKKEDLVIEGTEKMKNELARQRQIMRNACVIMNEATEIGSTPFKSQPEAEHDNSGDKDYPFTKAGKAEEDRGAIKFGEGNPEKHSATFGPDSNDVEDYNLDKGKTPKVDNSVASENPKGGKVARVNESMEECGAACGMKECGTTGMMPEEGEEDLDLGGDDNAPVDTDTLEPAEPIEGGVEAEPADTDDAVSDDIEMGLDDTAEESGGESDIDARISELESELAALKAERDGGTEDLDLGDDDEDLDLGDDEDFDFDDDEDLDLDDDEDLDDEEFGDDEDLDLGDDDEELDLGDDDEDLDGEGEEFDDDEDPEIELDENVVKKFRQLVRESINEMFTEKKQESVNEAKAAKMNSIVESVVKDILAEDELHVFGDHPGYRKKPMDLPPTGSDKFQDNRDWNDDSVHSEEPFGQGKGDSTPFDQLVAQITDSVMKQINEGKKKVK